jgi:hypothetical protein
LDREAKKIASLFGRSGVCATRIMYHLLRRMCTNCAYSNVYIRSRNSTFWLKWLGGEKGLRIGRGTFKNVSNYFFKLKKNLTVKKKLFIFICCNAKEDWLVG